VASNYEVNIKLNTRTVNKQLNNLEKRISKLNKLAQGGRASRTVLRNEQHKIKMTGQRLGLEQKILKRKQDQVKVDKQALEVEKRRINLTNKPRGGGGGGGKSKAGGNRFATAGQSAIISGAFPLLFGQGPLVGGAGFIGGGLGSLIGGQMGGFAGGLLATSIATPIQQLGIEAAKLGQALDPATKNVEALTAALGVTGTEFEKQLATLKKLGDEEAAFEAARQKMVTLIGQSGVDNMTKFGQEMTELGNNFTKIMTLMKNSMANFIQNSGILKLIATTVERSALIGQAEAYGSTLDTVEGRKLNELVGKRKNLTNIFGKDAIGDKERGNLAIDILGKEKGSGLFGLPSLKDVQDAKKLLEDEIVALQKKINLKDSEAEAEKMIEAIQKSRVKNLDKEIEMLERSLGMTSAEFEIEKQIAEMKEEGEIKDEDELRRKLQKIQLLTEERKLAEETAAAFERMSQTIATDISQGIQGMIRGTSTLNDMLNNVLNKLIDAAFNMAFFGNPQGTLGGGGLFGSIFGGLGSMFGGGGSTMGGGGYYDPVTGLGTAGPNFGLADGGTARAGRTHLVGERGPELFTPGVTGTVTPNHALGGTTNIVVNVDASGTSVEGDQTNGEELGRLIGAAVQAELIKEKRPGGLLG
tara:strand:+ start:2383 stop:4308 length:1926 start_codon:yes stop_codon:yes gene_type:complete